MTVYGTDNKLLIPNKKRIYDRTSYTSERNDDGNYVITLSPNGEGKVLSVGKMLRPDMAIPLLRKVRGCQLLGPSTACGDSPQT